MSEPTTEAVSWPELHRVRRAIVVVDVVESVRLMQAHEADFIERWRRFVHEVRTVVLPKHGGRMVKSLGDGMLLEFEAVPAALEATLAAFAIMRRGNQGRASDVSFWLRGGLHVGDIVADDVDVYGPTVNMAARLAALAAPGELVASAEAREEIVADFDAVLDDMGECYLKHLVAPQRAFRLRAGGTGMAAMAPEADAAMVPRIAVMPFAPLPGAPGTDAISITLSDDLARCLSRCPFLAVTSTLSSAALARRAMTAMEIARLLRVDYVLAGSMTGLARRIRLSLQLSDGRSGDLVWADVFEFALKEAWSVEGPVAARIAGSIVLELVRRQLAVAHTLPLPNLPSYSLLLQSIGLLHSLARPSFNRAGEVLLHLADRHPRSPESFAWLAKWHMFRIFQRWSENPERERLQARQALDKACDANPHHALTQALCGHVSISLNPDLSAAESHLRLALEANPSEPLAWLFKAHVHLCQGQHADACVAIERARGLSPIDPMSYFYDAYAASIYGAAGDTQEALRSARRAVALNRSHLASLVAKIIAEHEAHLHEEARATARHYLAIRPEASVARFIEFHPVKDKSHVQREADALLAAGLPM